MGYGNSKPKSVGSIFVNAPKDADPAIISRGQKALEFLKDNNFNFAVSLKDGDGYAQFIAFFNTYKKTSKDRDLTIFEKISKGASSKKSAPKAASSSDDTIPF